MSRRLLQRQQQVPLRLAIAPVMQQRRKLEMHFRKVRRIQGKQSAPGSDRGDGISQSRPRPGSLPMWIRHQRID